VIELDDGDRLRAREPTRAEVAKAASQLASFYNDPHNRAMLAHEDHQSAADVRAHYRELQSEESRAFFLDFNDKLVGDADLRHVTRDHAEVAILIGDRSLQGRGLGTRFGVMLHAFAFRALHLRITYATIIPANAGSLRLFAKLGYEVDDTPVARQLIDDPTDVTLSLTAERFEKLHGPLADRVRVVSTTATPDRVAP
jgi:RimJ/RimL family protein N-acetyltransferase